MKKFSIRLLMPILAIGIGIFAMSFKPSLKNNQIVTGNKVLSSITAKQVKQNNPLVTDEVALVIMDPLVEACPELLVLAAVLAIPPSKARLSSMNEDKFYELLSKSEELSLDTK